MNSPGGNSSKFKNLMTTNKRSPIEIKAKMRKNYKDKVQKCRHTLLNRIRGSDIEKEICSTLTEIYKSMFHSSTDDVIDEDELKNELLREEMEWLLKEYEKSQMDNIDWSKIEQEDNVICPVCQKNNLILQENILSCPHCNTDIKTQKSLPEIKQSILSSVEKHNCSCNSDVQFTIVPDLNETHIYLLCETCMEMSMII